MVFSPFERMVAFRYLRARREEGFVSVIAGFSLAGIALGVATLIIVMSVMNGFRAELLDRILGLNGHLEITASNRLPLRDFDTLAKQVRAIPGVSSVTPVVQGQVLASANGVASGALVRGLRLADFKAREALSASIKRGDIEAFKGKSTVVVGTRFANRFGLIPGSRLTLISPQFNRSAVGPIPRKKTYRVVALFELGMFEYDNNFIFMPLEAAQLFFKQGQGVSNLEVLVHDPDDVQAITGSVLGLSPGRHSVRDWEKANQSYFDALAVERHVMFLILTLIILVAAFNIISSMIMLVKDKGRDIAILRTMGATRGMVMRVFFLAGSSIGIVGTATGFALGLAFSANIETIRQWVQKLTDLQLFPGEIYFLSHLPAKVETWDVISVVVLALSLSFLATIYPAWRAARLDPVEALRYE